MRRAILALALLALLVACDMGWGPQGMPKNDNGIAPLRCDPPDVEWLCQFQLANVDTQTKFRSVLVCADSDPSARAEVKRAFPSACVTSCKPTGALTGAGGDGPGECAACSATGEPCSADTDCCGTLSLCYDGACD